MFSLITQNLSTTLTAALGAFALIIGINRILVPKIRSSKLSGFARWVSFLLIAFLGIVQGAGFYIFTRWATGLSGNLVGVAANLGQLVAIGFGMYTFLLITGGVRDLADKIPDEDARRCAWWLPTTFPAGWNAVLGVLHNPRGVGSGLTAALVGVEALVFAFLITRSALTSGSHKTAWKYYTAVVNILAGIIAIPLMVYADATMASLLPGPVLTIVRVIFGIAGALLAIGLIADMCDLAPDQYARWAFAYGIPILFVFGSVVSNIANAGVTGINNLPSTATAAAATTHTGAGK